MKTDRMNGEGGESLLWQKKDQICASLNGVSGSTGIIVDESAPVLVLRGITGSLSSGVECDRVTVDGIEVESLDMAKVEEGERGGRGESRDPACSSTPTLLSLKRRDWRLMESGRSGIINEGSN